jgi:hypothetical protein
MAENETTLEIKKRELKEELRRPGWSQNKHKIERLQESIKRHKDIAISIKEIRKRKFKGRPGETKWTKKK